MSQIVRVALNRPIRRLFDYVAPNSLTLEPGQRVTVPFGRYQAIGLVAETDVTPPAGITLKPVTGVLEHWPALPAETMALLTWAAGYYQHPLGECLFMALPPALRKGRTTDAPASEQWWAAKPGADTSGIPTNAHRQRQLFALLQESGGGKPWEELRARGFTRQHLNALAQRSLIHTIEPPDPMAAETGEPPTTPVLTQAQEDAARELPDRHGFSASLLYGITGSGKTEIYLHYLHRELAADGQALVLVPEINLTPQTVARFRKYLGDRIVVWHSA